MNWGRDDELLCWMQCMSIADLQCSANAGTVPGCYDTATSEVVAGDIMCPGGTAYCTPMCVSASLLVDPGGTAFCTGSGVDMFMDGFTTLAGAKPPCLNLLFKTWTLDSGGKFAAACLGVIALGVASELLGRVRRRAHKTFAEPSTPQGTAAAALLFGECPGSRFA